MLPGNIRAYNIEKRDCRLLCFLLLWVCDTVNAGRRLQPALLLSNLRMLISSMLQILLHSIFHTHIYHRTLWSLCQDFFVVYTIRLYGSQSYSSSKQNYVKSATWWMNYVACLPNVSNVVQYTLRLKKVPTFKLSVTMSNLNWFSNFLHYGKAYA